MIAVGMDVSKDKINVCVSLNEKAGEEKKNAEFTIKNNITGFYLEHLSRINQL